jgi:hypothetical protein
VSETKSLAMTEALGPKRGQAQIMAANPGREALVDALFQFCGRWEAIGEGDQSPDDSTQSTSYICTFKRH